MSASIRSARCCKGIGAGEIRELLVFNKIDLSGDKPCSNHRGSRWGGDAGVGFRGDRRGS